MTLQSSYMYVYVYVSLILLLDVFIIVDCTPFDRNLNMNINLKQNPFTRVSNEYTLYEQQQTHYEAALYAYQKSDIQKSIRIFEYLSKNLGPKSTRYKYVVSNLGILYLKLGDTKTSIKWAKISLQFDETNVMSGFILGINLFNAKQLYDAFMSFREIKDLKIPLRKEFDTQIQYNLGVTLYNLGGNGNEFIEKAIEQMGIHIDPETKLRYHNAKLGIESVDYGPVDFRLYASDGSFDSLPFAPLSPNNHNEKYRNVASPDVVLSPPSPPLPLLRYYFEHDENENGPSSAPIPYAHQIPKHMDHQEDYFTPKYHQRVPTHGNTDINSPNINAHNRMRVKSPLSPDSRYPAMTKSTNVNADANNQNSRDNQNSMNSNNPHTSTKQHYGVLTPPLPPCPQRPSFAHTRRAKVVTNDDDDYNDYNDGIQSTPSTPFTPFSQQSIKKGKRPLLNRFHSQY